MAESPYLGSYVQVPIFNQMVPDEGAKSIKTTLNFDSYDTYVVDLTAAMDAKVIQTVQSVYIDNSANLNKVTLDVELSGQRIIFPASSQGYLPILIGRPGIFKASAVAGTTKIIMMNVPIFPYIWTVA